MVRLDSSRRFSLLHLMMAIACVCDDSYYCSELDELCRGGPSSCGPHPLEADVQGIAPCTLRDEYPVPTSVIPPLPLFVAFSHAFLCITNGLVLACAQEPEPQIRIIINDGVAPLTGIRGCPEQKDGMCPLPTFIEAQKEIIAKADWTWACHGDWEVPAGTAWNTTTGDPPAP